MIGFEPTTLCSQSRCATPALHPVGRTRKRQVAKSDPSVNLIIETIGPNAARRDGFHDIRDRLIKIR